MRRLRLALARGMRLVVPSLVVTVELVVRRLRLVELVWLVLGPALVVTAWPVVLALRLVELVRLALAVLGLALAVLLGLAVLLRSRTLRG